MAGSIPVLDNWIDDISFWMHGQNYTFFTTGEVVNMKMSSAELKRIADANYETLIEYNTYIHGDNVPPSEPVCLRELCSSDPTCMERCQSLNRDM